MVIPKKGKERAFRAGGAAAGGLAVGPRADALGLSASAAAFPPGGEIKALRRVGRRADALRFTRR